MSEPTTMFAYNQNRVGECECPAVAAGFDPEEDDEVRSAAARYDEQIWNMEDVDSPCMVEEDVARKAWLAALDDMVSESRKFEAGQKIAVKLGWLEVDDE